jgi:hypothetical protein
MPPTLYVANMNGSTFIALPGSGCLDGIAVYNYEWVPALLLAVPGDSAVGSVLPSWCQSV